jgi:hypothetical protein
MVAKRPNSRLDTKVFLNVVEAVLWITLVSLSLEWRTVKRAHEARCDWLTDPFTHLAFIIEGRISRYSPPPC